MQQYPPIKIKPDASPQLFIERLLEVATELTDYSCELEDDTENESLSLHLKSQAVGPDNLMIRITSSKRTDVKHVHIRLNRPEWKTDIPEYSQYTHLCKDTLEELLKDYNRRYKTRLRLIVKSLEKLEPKLTPKIQQAFDDFATHAHKELLGGKDWERYYRFIRLAHAFNVRMDEEQLFFLLTHAGFSKQYSREISDVYTHGRALLGNK